MRQKTLIAATVLGGAPVLLLDEPLIGLIRSDSANCARSSRICAAMVTRFWSARTSWKAPRRCATG